MGTWLGAIVETAGRADFWDIARRNGVDAVIAETPPYVLVDCGAGDFRSSVRLAEALSKDLGATAIGFVVQTTADVHELHAFDRGTAIRRLAYSRDDDGWVQVEGTPQPWERTYFFDPTAASTDAARWPDMLWDDLPDDDLARYEAARRVGDASSVLDLMHPSSTAPMHRVCAALGVRPDAPHGRWKKPSLLSRWFGRSD